MGGPNMPNRDVMRVAHAAEKKAKKKAKRERKESKKKRKEELKEKGFVRQSVGGLREKIFGKKVWVDEETGMPAPIGSGSTPATTAAKHDRDELRKILEGDEGAHEDASRSLQPQAGPGRTAEGTDVTDQEAVNDVIAALREAIVRGYSRAPGAGGTVNPIWNLVTERGFVEYINDPNKQFNTPLENWDHDYRDEYMKKVRKDLEEKLLSKDIGKLTGPEMDVILVTMLNHPHPSCKETLFDYIQTVAEAEREPENVGGFMGTVLNKLAELSTTMFDINPAHCQGLMSEDTATEFLGAVGDGILENAVTEFAAKLPEDMDEDVVERHKTMFKHMLLSDPDAIRNPKIALENKKSYMQTGHYAVQDRVMEDVKGLYGKDIKDPDAFKEEAKKVEEKIDASRLDDKTKKEMKELVAKIRHHAVLNNIVNEIMEGDKNLQQSLKGELTERKLGMAQEKADRIKEKVDASELDDETKKEVKKCMEDMLETAETKMKLVKEKREELNSLGKDAKKDVVNNLKENIKQIIADGDLDLIAEDSRLYDIRSKKMPVLKEKGNPVVKAAVEVIEKMKVTKTDERITDEQWLLATIAYEGGRKKTLDKPLEGEPEIKDPKAKWLNRIAMFPLIDPEELEADKLKELRKELKNELKEGWVDYWNKKPRFLEEKNEKVVLRYMTALSTYLVNGANEILEKDGEVDYSDNTYRRAKGFTKLAIDKTLKTLNSLRDYEDYEELCETYEKLCEAHGEEKVTEAMMRFLFTKTDKYYSAKDKEEKNQIAEELEGVGIVFKKNWNDFEKAFDRFFKLADNYLQAPWLSWNKVRKIRKRALRVLAQIAHFPVNLAQILTNGVVGLFVKLPKYLLWDLQIPFWPLEGKKLGIVRRVYGHLRNSKDPVYKMDKKSRLRYQTKRGYLGAWEAAIGATIIVTAASIISLWPFGDKNDFLKKWRGQIMRWPVNYEAAYPTFKKSPLSHEGWRIANESYKPGERPPSEFILPYLVTDPKKDPDAKPDKAWLLQFHYADVTRKNYDAKMLERNEQLEFIQNNPDVAKFLAERRFGYGIGTILYDKGRPVSVKSKVVSEKLEAQGWKKMGEEKIKRKVTGHIYGKRAIVDPIEDGLKLNTNKTEAFVKDLMKYKKDGVEINKEYLESMLETWKDREYVIPGIIEAYMNTYGVTKVENAELLMANPEIAKWLAPRTVRKHAPDYIKPENVEKIIEMLKAEIIKETGEVGSMPILPVEKRNIIFGAVMRQAIEDGLAEDVTDEYKRYLTINDLKMELGEGKFYPKDELLVDYLLENEVKDEWFSYLKGEIEDEDAVEIRQELINHLSKNHYIAYKEQQIEKELKRITEWINTLSEELAKAEKNKEIRALEAQIEDLKKVRGELRNVSPEAKLNTMIRYLESKAVGEADEEGFKQKLTAAVEENIKKEMLEYLHYIRKERDVKHLLLQYKKGSAVRSIIPGRVEAYLTLIINHIDNGGSANDFNPVDGKMLPYAEGGYVKSGLKALNTIVETISEDLRDEGSVNFLGTVDGLLSVLQEDDQKYRSIVEKYGKEDVENTIHMYLLAYVELARRSDPARKTLSENGIELDVDGYPYDEDIVKVEEFIKKEIIEEINKSGLEDFLYNMKEKFLVEALEEKVEEGLSPEVVAALEEKYGTQVKLERLANPDKVKVFENDDGRMTVLFLETNTAYDLDKTPTDVIDMVLYHKKDGKKNKIYKKLYKEYEDIKGDLELIEKDKKPVYKMSVVYDEGVTSAEEENTAYLYPDGTITREEE